MMSKDRSFRVIRLVGEMAELAEEDQLEVIRGALEKRKRKMVRAPYGSRVLSPDEIEELLSYGPPP